MRIVFVMLMVIVVAVALRLHEPGPAVIGSGSEAVLISYDVNKKPGFLDEQKLWDVLDAHPGKGHWRIVESTATFATDQPEFRALAADTHRNGPDWITFGSEASGVAISQALPATEEATESIIRKYAK